MGRFWGRLRFTVDDRNPDSLSSSLRFYLQSIVGSAMCCLFSALVACAAMVVLSFVFPDQDLHFRSSWIATFPHRFLVTLFFTVPCQAVAASLLFFVASSVTMLLSFPYRLFRAFKREVEIVALLTPPLNPPVLVQPPQPMLTTSASRR
jgi:hypothetical protein